MNECEFRESTTSIITLFGGMFFILSDLPEALSIILIIIIFCVNVWFFTLWLHVFLRDSRFAVLRFLSLFLGKVSCLGKEYWKKEVVQSLKTDKGLTVLFGKEYKDEVKITKFEENKDGDQIIGESENQKSKGITDEKGGDGSKGKTSEGADKKKKKKKKLKKKKAQTDAVEVEVPIDN